MSGQKWNQDKWEKNTWEEEPSTWASWSDEQSRQSGSKNEDGENTDTTIN